MKTSRRTVWPVLVIWLCAAGPALGQWVEQTYPLQVGWNSIYLEVNPAPRESDLLFDGLPIESVWMRALDPLATQQETDCDDPDDPACVPVEDTQWRVWVPPDNPGRLAVNLHIIQAGAYMIKATAPTELTVVGMPATRKTGWREGYTFSGLHVVEDPGAAPSFQQYLAASALHANPTVYRKSLDGSLLEVADLSQPIMPSRSYWIRTDGDGVYDGPIEIDDVALSGLTFGNATTQLPMTVTNLASTNAFPTIELMASADPPLGVEGVVPNAGLPVAMWKEYFGGTDPNTAIQWMSFPLSTSLASTGNPVSSRVLDFGVDRAAMGPAAGEYQGVLTVRDDNGFRRWVGLSTAVSSQEGLWLGQVVMNRVVWGTAGAPIIEDFDADNDYENPTINTNGMDGDTTSLRPTGTDFVFPVIIHLDDMGNYTLLTEVSLRFREGDLETEGKPVLATPGCPPGVCTGLGTAETVNDRPFARRYSTAAYAFDGDLAMSGDFGTTLTADIVLPADHRLNPFRHRHHPDHDCNEPGECYDVTRHIEFHFEGVPPEGSFDPGYGFTTLGGTYEEVLTVSYTQTVVNESCLCSPETGRCSGGPNENATCSTDEDCDCVQMYEHSYSTRAGGRFSMNRVSEIPRLNDVE